jgi:microcystin-dependent protein
MAFAGSFVPSGWRLCDGSSCLTTNPAYSELFSVIGFTYGGSGTYFNLPNLNGKMILGQGGGYTIGSTGGASSVTLAANQIPLHAHDTLSQGNGYAASDGGNGNRANTGGKTGTTIYDSAGNVAVGGVDPQVAVPILNPYLALLYIIKV